MIDELMSPKGWRFHWRFKLILEDSLFPGRHTIVVCSDKRRYLRHSHLWLSIDLHWSLVIALGSLGSHLSRAIGPILQQFPWSDADHEQQVGCSAGHELSLRFNCVVKVSFNIYSALKLYQTTVNGRDVGNRSEYLFAVSSPLCSTPTHGVPHVSKIIHSLIAQT